MEFLLDFHPDAYPLEGFRRRQLLEWVFVQGVGDFSAMTNLPAELRTQLQGAFHLNPFREIETVRSADGSVKYLFTLQDGRQMEAVYMPYLDRKTVCVSTMVGCPARCAFCATGAMGFGRNLTPGEIVAQVLAVAGGEGLAPRELRNLVFMGMGEAMLNYENTMAAARDYQAVTGRRITMEYTMLRGINDHPWQAELLAERLRGLVSHVNLIPMNPWEGSGFQSSTEEQIQTFYDILESRGVDVSVRRSRGKDAGAACGQLALKRPGAVSGAVSSAASGVGSGAGAA